jgi:tetratricopeptide (TPR) repeat protein
MKPLPIGLARDEAATRVGAPAAWLLPTGDPSAWAARLAAFGPTAVDARLFAVPERGRSRAAAALLVVPSSSAAAPRRWDGALPLRRAGERLFVPVDAVLDPPMTAAEIDAVFAAPVCLLHPAYGYAAFSAEDAFDLAAVVAPPPIGTRAFDDADPGPPPPPDFLRIAAQEREPDPQLTSLRDDIGTKSPTDLAPPKPVAPAPKRPSLWGRMKAFLAGVFGGAPRRPGRAAAARPPSDLERRRESAIDRLLDLLERDPDAGLRFALPLGGDPGRGAAPPGATLPARATDYVAPTSASGPVDGWELDFGRQWMLKARYLAAARREEELGRHRRAAYVYATLLRDFREAARVLERGGHHREAADLYRERLSDPLEAARCYLRGELWIEAAAAFEAAEEFGRAADVHDRLGAPAAALALRRRWVDRLVAKGALLEAADVLERKLGALDEALGLLDRSPPDLARRAEAFALLGRAGRHAEALRRIGAAQRPSDPDADVVSTLRLLGGVAIGYVDAGVRAAASDAARVVAGRRLADDPLADPTIVRLLPEPPDADAVFRRDVARFVESRRTAAGPAARKRGRIALRPRGKFAIAHLAALDCTFATARGLLFVFDWGSQDRPGCGAEVWCLRKGIRLTWFYWQLPTFAGMQRWAFSDASGLDRVGFVVGVGGIDGPRFAERQATVSGGGTTPSGDVERLQVSIGTSKFVPSGALAACDDPASGRKCFLTADADGTIGVVVTASDGERLATHRTEYGLGDFDNGRWDAVRLAAVAGGFVAVFPRAATLEIRVQPQGVEARWSVEASAGAYEDVHVPPHDRTRCVFVAADGCVLRYAHGPDGAERRFNVGHATSAAAFLRDGRFAVADDAGLALYDLVDDPVEVFRDPAFKSGEVFALLPNAAPNEIVVVSDDRTVEVLAFE